ncbi:hypothetical protein OIU74_020370 [Salix koriyanagi]|uniref:Uncharacterized protein n=1 Tax=Salix koriyanagi TaxID=2511006 RepID=A0A9Q0P5S2_9ROSI|nr:hypothetical protein OIU74_020370 [Salix koriyanagi]
MVFTRHHCSQTLGSTGAIRIEGRFTPPY